MTPKMIMAVSLSAASILSYTPPAAANAEVGVDISVGSDQGFYDPDDCDECDYSYIVDGPPDGYDYDEPDSSGWDDVDGPDDWANEPSQGGDWHGHNDDDD